MYKEDVSFPLSQPTLSWSILDNVAIVLYSTDSDEVLMLVIIVWILQGKSESDSLPVLHVGVYEQGSFLTKHGEFQ